MSQTTYNARIYDGVGAISKRDWERLDGSDNPFVSHAFLSALEDSDSVGPGTGWTPVPLVLESEADGAIAALPAYLKTHSQGEYVFDHAFADAYERAGGSYYPKLQIAAPFTPATGPRILTREPQAARIILQAAEQMCRQNGFSSAHATFIEPDQIAAFEQAGWLLRSDIQFHWRNHGFDNFEDFLATFASRKRKNLRKERAQAQDGVAIKRLRGEEIAPEHWDAFWLFYQDTGARKWGRPYLTRAAFDLFAERMGERILMVLAFKDGEPVAGALNFIGADALYGRYWGCSIDKPFLHFELCYYQAIDAAIELGVDRVEAGAQGGHKLARGYEPVETTSAHFFADTGFRTVVADYLQREREGVVVDRNYLSERTPFKKDG